MQESKDGERCREEENLGGYLSDGSKKEGWNDGYQKETQLDNQQR